MKKDVKRLDAVRMQLTPAGAYWFASATSSVDGAPSRVVRSALRMPYDTSRILLSAEDYIGLTLLNDRDTFELFIVEAYPCNFSRGYPKSDTFEDLERLRVIPAEMQEHIESYYLFGCLEEEKAPKRSISTPLVANITMVICITFLLLINWSGAPLRDLILYSAMSITSMLGLIAHALSEYGTQK